MEIIKGKVHLLFEQSGVFKNEFKKLGYKASDWDIPNMLGKSYRQCCENGDFDKIERQKRVGIYSKVNALLWKVRAYNPHCKHCNENKRYGD